MKTRHEPTHAHIPPQEQSRYRQRYDAADPMEVSGLLGITKHVFYMARRGLEIGPSGSALTVA